MATDTARTRGAGRIRAAFAAAREDARTAFIPYVVCGRPSLRALPSFVAGLAGAGADIVELGVPFSDPLADGAVIRDATRRALDDGVDVAGCLDVVRELRGSGVDVPVVLMGYVNPLLAYGLARFVRDAALAGVDGLIVPDVPLAEAGELRAFAAEHGVGLSLLATPLTGDARLRELAAASTGFLYAMATTGTTGARGELDPRTRALLGRARAAAPPDVPVAVGFGISTPEHVAALRSTADGVIVGSRIVDELERAGTDAALRLAGELARAAAAPTAATSR